MKSGTGQSGANAKGACRRADLQSVGPIYIMNASSYQSSHLDRFCAAVKSAGARQRQLLSQSKTLS
jgi:hypothetical protein